MKLPSSVYRYEPINNLTLKNLKSQVVYFSSPQNFNDPYDCAINAEPKIPKDRELKQYLRSWLKRDDVPQEVKDDIENYNPDVIRSTILKNATETIERERSRFLKKAGVLCFSATKSNTLMWSHYADWHKGFCFEFSTEHDPFKKLLRVQYKSSIPKIDFVSSMKHQQNEAILDLFLTKSSDWKYEQEWRAIHTEAHTIYPYPPESLLSISFGSECDDTLIEIVCLTIQGQNPNVKFFKGKKAEKKFQITFDEFEYIPHIKTKDYNKAT